MSKFNITTSIFYRWRYWIGYSVITVSFAALLFIAGFLIPGEVSMSEIGSVVASHAMSTGNLLHTDLTNAPFYLLQHGTLTLFGATLLGIKLPALILGTVTALCMFFLLRRWFSPGIAVLASMLVITTGQFLFLTQSGSTGILYLFWPTVILLLSTLVANRTRGHGVWKILLFVAAGLSLYTPLSSYVLLAIISAAILHPHLRHVIRRLPRWRFALGFAAMLVVISPLIYVALQSPQIALSLLGVPLEMPDLLENGTVLLSQYFGFMSFGTKSVILPVFGLASSLLILYGLLRCIRTYSTVQSYVILSWAILLLPILVLNPQFVSIMFVPQLLLLASGLSGVLRRWYKLFPKNPYARVAGLVPLIILVGGMALFGLERYAYAYRYAPETMQNFTRDVVVIPDVPTLVVSEQELPAYQAIAAYKNNLVVSTTVPQSGRYAATSNAHNASATPTFVVASNRRDDGVRFYIYNTSVDAIIDEVQNTEGE